jgi:glycerol uptake facilitator-like aquaporin
MLFRGAWTRIVSWATNSRPSLLTKGAAEFTGCMLFHFLGSASPTPATNAVALMVLVYYTAKLSGAHLNPALTTTFALLGYTNPVELVVYWIAQFSGCIAGALWLALLVPGLSVGGDTSVSRPAMALSGCFTPAPDISGIDVLGWEAVCTFCFILPIFSVVWYTQSKSGYGNTGPIIVGLSLYAAATVAGPWTGAALNPARAVASHIVFQCPTNAYIGYYVAGELIGAAVVPIAVAPWYGMSMRSVMRTLHERAYSYGGGAPEDDSIRTHLTDDGEDAADDEGYDEEAAIPVSPLVPVVPPPEPVVDAPDSNTSSSRRVFAASRLGAVPVSPSALRMHLQVHQQQQQQQPSIPFTPRTGRRNSLTLTLFPPENMYMCSPVVLPGRKSLAERPRASVLDATGRESDATRQNSPAPTSIALTPTNASPHPTHAVDGGEGTSTRCVTPVRMPSG